MGAEFQWYGEPVRAATLSLLKERVNQVIEAAEWDHGHSGYSGSYAEKQRSQVTVVPPPEGREFWDAGDAEDHCVDNNDKWGPAFAYQVATNTYVHGGWCSS